MKFLKSFLLISGLVLLIVKIFENSTFESRKEVEKITIDFNPDKNTVKVNSVKLPVDSETNQEEQGDELIEAIENTPKAEQKELVAELATKLHEGENILTPRQKKIVDVLARKTKVDTTMLQPHIPKVTVRTLRRDLESLTKMGILKKMGSTKGSYYVRA